MTTTRCHATRVGTDGADRGNLITGSAQVFAEQVDQGTHERADGEPQRGERESPRRCLREEDVEGRSTIQSMPASRLRRALSAPVIGRFAMMYDGLRHHTHLVTRPPGTPAQI